MASFSNRTVATNGIRMAVRDEGEGPAVVLCHGFPDIAYSWRHVVPALKGAGFRALAPDQRGYGSTECPADVATYDIHHLTGDLVGLLDALGIRRAVIVGHDWGGNVAWMTALLHPERVAGVVGVNTPHFPRSSGPPIAIMRAIFGDNFYMVHFQQPGVADDALARDVRRVFTQLVRTGVPLDQVVPSLAPGGRVRNLVEAVLADEAPGEPLLSEAELDVYVEAFTRTGFTGGLNWYRNLDRNWETTADLAGARITVPSLMITAEWDPVLRPELAEAMRPLVPDLEVVMIPRCGHWTPHERPADLNRLLVEWLSRRYR